MSEPRYDFLLVTIREHNKIGYVITDVFLVYSPVIPQHDSQRLKWCKNEGVLKDLASAFSDQIGKTFALRHSGTGTFQKILWDVVPVLGAHESMVSQVKSAKLTCSRKFVVLPVTFWYGSADRIKWFFDRFKEFHKSEKAQYILDVKK